MQRLFGYNCVVRRCMQRLYIAFANFGGELLPQTFSFLVVHYQFDDHGSYYYKDD